MISLYNGIGIIWRWKKFNYAWDWHFKKFLTKENWVSWGVLFKGSGVQKDTQTPCWLSPWTHICHRSSGGNLAYVINRVFFVWVSIIWFANCVPCILKWQHSHSHCLLVARFVLNYLGGLLSAIEPTGDLGYDGPLYDGFLHMTDDMLGPSPMHIKYSSYVYNGFCIWRTNFPGPIESVISKFTCIT